MRLDNRLESETGRYFMPAIQALVRLPIEQMKRDRLRGLRTGSFITGFPGSPLGGYDLALENAGDILSQHNIVFQPAGNEEQAATALMGTQMLDRYEHSRFDGVVGFWYGKGPGLDRAGDAIRHGNFAGTSEHGAVVILSGEDHDATSSTMPHQQDYELMGAGIPILYPSSVSDIRRLGLHAVEMSRFSGCWVALKLVSTLCDSGATITMDQDDIPISLPDVQIGHHPFKKQTDFTFFPGANIEQEAHLFNERHRAVLEYARANTIDHTWWAPDTSKGGIGIVTGGKSAADLQQAFLNAGLDQTLMAAAGVKVLQLGLIWPIDREQIQSFAHDLDLVVVVEEKRSVIEDQVKQALQESGNGVRVIGKRDLTGGQMFPIQGGFGPDMILERLAPHLDPLVGEHMGIQRELRRIRKENLDTSLGLSPRTPNYCSGCPHSASTVLAEGQIAWGSPGCHSFATTMEQPHRQVNTMTQLGGEGLPWIGLAPFTDRPHIVQNVGDGSLYHSSYNNIRWAVDSGVDMTFKILWNGFVANTGGQEVVGSRGVPALVRQLAADGVSRIVLVTKEPERYHGDLESFCQIRNPREVAQVSAELSKIGGTTVMIYDESCANERRRRRKRGTYPLATRHLLINEEVCEACGDCGVKSNCMSLQSVDTELGPKTQIHRSSCNQDYTCLEGDCPSYVTVTTKGSTRYRSINPPSVDAIELPDPDLPEFRGPYRIYIPGVGGTGVITLNAMLAVAVLADGHDALTYDQTGAAQKWGAVLSSLTIIPKGSAAVSSRIETGQADLYLGLDTISAVSDENLKRIDHEATRVVINTDVFPTGKMIRDPLEIVAIDPITQTLKSKAHSVYSVPARSIAEALFDDWMLTNVIALGAAYQSGLVPITSDSIEQAIEINGVAVERNLTAFRYGRLWIAERSRVMNLVNPPPTDYVTEREKRAEHLGRNRSKYLDLLDPIEELPEDTRRHIAIRAARMIDYQNVEYAQQYMELVCRSLDAERRTKPETYRLAEAVATNLFKVMAYKDEYEVARLLTLGSFEDEIHDIFEGSVKVSYNLLPPFFRRIGRTSKVRVPGAFRFALKILATLKGLRGTPLDPFGFQSSRREEREIREWYTGVIGSALEQLNDSTYEQAVELAQLPKMIRGYESIKSAGYAKARAEALRLSGAQSHNVDLDSG